MNSDSLLKLISCRHALKLCESYNSLRPRSLYIALHILHDLLTSKVNLINLLLMLVCFFMIYNSHSLKLLLFMEQVSHLHHEIHLSVITKSKRDVHQIVLVLVYNPSFRVGDVPCFLIDLLYPLPESCLKFSHIIMRR